MQQNAGRRGCPRPEVWGVGGSLVSFSPDLSNKQTNKQKSQVQSLRPVIPAFGRLGRVDHLRSGVRDQPDQHGETPSLLKIQN